MRPWELVSMELDKHAKAIGDYFEKQGRKIRRVKYHRQLYDGYRKKTDICNIVKKALGKGTERKLVVYGSGSYHHFTYGLCRHADRISKNYGYIHFDHHHDSFVKGDNSLDCGSFVSDILKDTNTDKALYIGRSERTTSIILEHTPLMTGVTEEDLRKEKGFEELESKLASLPQEVYTSFDLDVMDQSLIYTGFDRGDLTLKELMECIALIKKTKHIIGADVLGYMGTGVISKRKFYEECEIDDAPGKEVYAEIIKSLLQQLTQSL